MGDPARRPGHREYRLPGALIMPATRVRVASAKSMFGAGKHFCPTSASIASATASGRLRCRAAHQVEQHDGPRVAAPVYEVPEPGTLP